MSSKNQISASYLASVLPLALSAFGSSQNLLKRFLICIPGFLILSAGFCFHDLSILTIGIVALYCAAILWSKQNFLGSIANLLFNFFGKNDTKLIKLIGSRPAGSPIIFTIPDIDFVISFIPPASLFTPPRVAFTKS